MAFVGELGKDHRFIGIISSNYLDDEMEYFRERVEEDIDPSTSFIYVYDSQNEKQDLEYLEGKEGPGSEGRAYRRELFDIRQLVEDEKVDKERFLLDLEDRMKKSNLAHKNIVYMTIDDLWSSDDEEEIKDFYRKLKGFVDQYDHGFVLRYILNELNQLSVYRMIAEHERVLLRNRKGLKAFETDELFARSMAAFSYYTEIEEEYEKAVMRVEYLKFMGELTEGIVHDINNILTTALGCLELIEINGYKEENRVYIDTIFRSIEEASGITTGVLGHMKGIENHHKDYYDLDSVVGFCLDLAEIKIGNLGKDREIDCIYELDSSSPIYVNEYDLRQAIFNVLFNAIDAMPDGGVLTVRTYDKDDQAILTIEDTGVGMSERTLEKIFESYYTTKGDSGTGIGLSMTRRICQVYDIDIEVESEEARGTKFIFSFPQGLRRKEEDYYDFIEKC